MLEARGACPAPHAVVHALSFWIRHRCGHSFLPDCLAWEAVARTVEVSLVSLGLLGLLEAPPQHLQRARAGARSEECLAEVFVFADIPSGGL